MHSKGSVLTFPFLEVPAELGLGQCVLTAVLSSWTACSDACSSVVCHGLNLHVQRGESSTHFVCNCSFGQVSPINGTLLYSGENPVHEQPANCPLGHSNNTLLNTTLCSSESDCTTCSPLICTVGWTFKCFVCSRWEGNTPTRWWTSYSLRNGHPCRVGCRPKLGAPNQDTYLLQVQKLVNMV